MNLSAMPLPVVVARLVYQDNLFQVGCCYNSIERLRRKILLLTRMHQPPLIISFEAI